MSKLSKRHKVFVDEFFNKKFNATEAYLAVYPKSNYNSARANSARLIATDNVKEEIKSRLAEMHMSSDEVLKEFTDLAHGDIGDFMDDYMNIDMRKAKALGITKLIKKIRQKTVTHQAKNESDEDRESHDVEIELYPRDKALEILGKYHGLFKEQVDVTSAGEKLNIIVKVGIDPDKL